MNTSNTQSQLIIEKNRIYLGYYLDGIKQEIISFKNGNTSAITRWSDKSATMVNSFPEINYVVRALGHAELAAEEGTDKPLDKLAVTLAKSLNAEYCPKGLRKSKVLEKSTGLSLAKRIDQVINTYSFSVLKEALEIDRPRFLIIDDVYTSGTTTKEIQRAIIHACPMAQVFVFTLVKTLYRSEANELSVEKHNQQLMYDLYNEIEENNEIIKTLIDNTKEIIPEDKLTKYKQSSIFVVNDHINISFNVASKVWVSMNLKYSVAKEEYYQQEDQIRIKKLILDKLDRLKNNEYLIITAPIKGAIYSCDNEKKDIGIKISLKVATNAWVNIPYDCKMSREDYNLSKDQKRLKNLLIDKIECAESDEELIIKVPIKVSFHRCYHNP